jgi:hypothetical protein
LGLRKWINHPPPCQDPSEHSSQQELLQTGS